MPDNLLKRVTTAAFVTGSAASTFFFSGNPQRRNRTEVFKAQQRIFDKNLIMPANATFALIWPVIYSGTVALAIHQALPSQRDNPRYQNARPWLWACYVLNAVFAYYFSRSDRKGRIGGGITTMVTLPFAVSLHRALEIGRTTVAQPERTFRTAISLYTGWVTIASVISGANILLDSGVHPSEQASARWAVAALPATTLLGLSVARRLNDPYYALAVGAGLIGIAAKQTRRHTAVATVAAGGVLSIVAWATRRLP